MQQLITVFLSADYSALNASLPPTLPHRSGRRPVQCALECFPDLHLPGDFLHSSHCVSEHQGQSLSLQTELTQHKPQMTTKHNIKNKKIFKKLNRCPSLLQITKLKINHNPFAKGFRDEGTNKKRWVSHTGDLLCSCKGPRKVFFDLKDEGLSISRNIHAVQWKLVNVALF